MGQVVVSGLDPAPQARRRVITGRRLAILVLLIACGVFWTGYHKTPLGAAEGPSLNGAATRPTAADKPLRVGVFNIQGGLGADNRYDLDRTAATMRGCDLLALCEVHGGSWTHPRDQAQLLGEKLEMPWLFAPAERRWWRDYFGNGILCDLPVTHWQRFPMSGANAKDNRSLLLVRARYGQTNVNVLIAHIERGDHDMQLKEIVELFESLAEPALLLGDLNAKPDHPVMRELLSDQQIVDAIAQIPTPDHRAPDHILWILARGLRCVDAGIIDNGASDHPFYWADLELPASHH